MTTIVSAFISNVNSRKDRNINDYYALGKLLLKSKTPKIIFLDKLMYNLIKNYDYDEDNTLIILNDKGYSNTYLYEYLHYINETFKLDTDNPEKDTWQYMFTMCNKTEFMREAIEKDIFNSLNYVWVDFGIRHIFKGSDDDFIQSLDMLFYKQYRKVRIGSIWDLNINYIVDLMTQIAWYFAGGVFGGDKTSLLKFADLMKSKCIYIMKNHKTIMWEVNIWYMIYKEHPELFDAYPCNHSNSLIENY